MKIREIYLVFVSAVSAVLFVACGRGNAEYDASGVFEATEVTVSALGTGEIMQFDIAEGANVKANVQVGYIDTIQLHLKKQQMLASLQSVDSRRYDVALQIASLRQQLETERGERARFEKLVKSNAANQKQLDDINSQIAVLEKQLSAQRATLENGNRSVSAEARGLEAQIAQLDDQIVKSRISSPVDGTVLAKYVESGEFAQQGKALFKVADMRNVYLRAYITADMLTSVKLGQKVKVYADKGEKDRTEYDGKVTWISDKAEFTPKTIQTRDERANLVYAVKIAVPNDGYIKLGMYGEVKLN